MSIIGKDEREAVDESVSGREIGERGRRKEREMLSGSMCVGVA